MELGVLGPLHVRRFGLPVAIPGAKPRSILTFLGLNGGAVVPGETLVELLWGTDPPRTAAKALQTHISALRRALGDGFVLTQGTGWTLNEAEIDALRYTEATGQGREAMAAGDASQAAARFDEALRLWRGAPELPDGRRGETARTRWVEGHAALVEDRADALLATGRSAELIGELEAAISDAPLRERRWGQLMLALYRAGRQGEALAAYQRARALLADELGVDPGPDLRRLESKIVVQDLALELPASQYISSVMRAVTFLLTDIEGSTAAWEADADAMAAALARHDEIVEQVVTFRGGRLIKTRGEGDATFSVFDRPSGAAAAAVELQEAIRRETWALAEPMRIRIALHTGEVEFRDGDYFGRAVNRAARLRSLATGGQTLCSGATAELVIDSLADDVVLADLGMRELKNLARPEHVFELRLDTTDDRAVTAAEASTMARPDLPAALSGGGLFVGRGGELAQLLEAWGATLSAGTRAVLIAGEPGVGKTRLAGEWSRKAYSQDAVVLYGRCDEDLGAPYQPFAEALRTLVPCLGSERLRGLRGVESLLPLVPALTEVLPDLAAAPRAAPDAERYALFDAVVALLGVASASAPIVLVLDDLHWAAKPTLLLLRHLLRFGEQARVQIVGTYRSTDLDRAHPLAAMLADLHRDGSATRLSLGGLDKDDVTAYVAEAGYDDDELARALASVTGGNPFFLIEALRHVDESDGHWDPNSLPQGVREAVSRRLSRLPAETNKALAAAAVVGSRFGIELVERVVERDLVDAFDEAGKAGIVIEEPGGRYRFNHALVRQSLLAELPSVRRMRLHHKIAVALESESGAGDELVGELAYHYFECAWAGNAGRAVEYCRRAADQAMARLGYEGAADLYDKALHALEELDDEPPDRADQQAELLVARCEALLAAGDVVSAAGAVAQLLSAAKDSVRLAAWGTCFDGQLSMLTDPERLDEIEAAVGAAAGSLAELGDAAGEAKAHTVRASCLARLGRVGDCETALDQALTAARRAHDHRRVNAVLAGAPLAALWGPNPVPRAGGRCLDVVRLLRITTGSPVVEATSTRCQGVLDALRGRAAAGRQLIDSARRTLNELGMRHAVLEVEQFAGIVELVADDATAAEQYLRKAYNGFRRMGLEADTAETAALLARACLALDRDAEAGELCTESERLAGHAFKAAIAWRSVRAQLLARAGDHDEARRVAEEAVAIAERTDALVDHGDACLALATLLDVAGDTAGARAAAERAAGLYELKGATALVEKARRLCVGAEIPPTAAPAERVIAAADSECVRRIRRLDAAVDREDWADFAGLFATNVSVESRRKVVGFDRLVFSSSECVREIRQICETDAVRRSHEILAVRGERVALTRMAIGTADESPGAARDELLELFGLDTTDRLALLVSFDVEDLDEALAEMEALHVQIDEVRTRPLLENGASRVESRCYALFAEGRVDDISALLSDDHRNEDRRLGLGRESNDRAAALANIRVIAGLGVDITNTPLALRGDRLCLSHIRFDEKETRGQGFQVETLELTELDPSGVMRARFVFDVDDLDAALAELDARYVAGEAAEYAAVWSTVAGALAAVNRHELFPTTPGWTNVDHRRGTRFAPGHMSRFIQEAWGATPDIRIYMEAVHRLTASGAVVTFVARGTTIGGFAAEWRDVVLTSVVGDKVSRSEMFDEADIVVALARFDELSRPAPRGGTAASLVYERLWNSFYAGDWDAVAEVFTDDISNDDRRRVVNAGIERGRDMQMANLRRLADIGATVSSTVLATRGQHLLLNRVRASNGDLRHGDFESEMFNVIETNSGERIVAGVLFDSDDLSAAFAELDARYFAGEAAPHAHTWSVITQAYARMTRGELPRTTANLVNVDHRHVAPMAPDGGIAYLRASWDLAPEFHLHIEAVHRLSDVGAVFTRSSNGTSRDGFDAEWRAIDLITVDGDLISRGEIFDESDLDAALVRFDELNRPAVLLENGASREYQRFNAHYTTGDWEALAKTMADDFIADDRRRFVGAGGQLGRDAAVDHARITADLGVRNATSTVVATRGERLALMRARFWGRDDQPDAFSTEVLHMVEIDAEQQITAVAAFDLDDLETAVAELDARYLAGEAAAHAETWSVIVGAFAAFNRRELPATTPDWINIDHRPLVSFPEGALYASIDEIWNLTPDVSMYAEAVHRLTDRGAVMTYAASGTSGEGLDVAWREVSMSTVTGDLVDRCEVFDVADLDAAMARFDDLSLPPARLENTASRTYGVWLAAYDAQDWDAMSEVMAEDVVNDDRRRVVNGGIQRSRAAVVANMRAIADVGVRNIEPSVVATRGDRLALLRLRVSGNKRPGAFGSDVLTVVEADTDNRFAYGVAFETDDLDAAFAELDGRFGAGEAAAHAAVWSVVHRNVAGFNRHLLPSFTPDMVNVDHRRMTAFAPGDQAAYVHATWDQTPDLTIYIEAIHRLDDCGAVFTYVANGTTGQAFEAEWRAVSLSIIEGHLISRSERFDEGDLEAALARFDELSQPAPRLQNTASQVTERSRALFAGRDWDGMHENLAPSFVLDDRRPTVNGGISRGRDTVIRDMRTGVDVGFTDLNEDIVALRGSRLVLTRARYPGGEARHETFVTEVLHILEIDADRKMIATIVFDPDDVDSAFAELELRYLAGEAEFYSRTWSLVADSYATTNRHEIPMAATHVVDHRRLSVVEGGDLIASLHAAWDLTPDGYVYIEAVHRLDSRGAVVTHVARGTGQGGFDARWRSVNVLTVGTEAVERCELFDESDLDTAIARFAEISRPESRLVNKASRVFERYNAFFIARDWDGMADMVVDDVYVDDRRRVVSGGIQRGQAAQAASMRAAADMGVKNAESCVIATRGERLVLMRVRVSGDQRRDAFGLEMLTVFEVNAEDRCVAGVLFDMDDFAAAFAELDSRYLAGEAARCATMWSRHVRAYAAVNRHEMPEGSRDWANVDHRKSIAFATDDMAAYVQATFNEVPNLQIYVEAVHRLTKLGVVVTHVVKGSSRRGFDAEWREIVVATLGGDDQTLHSEMFDETDLEVALARFNELSAPTTHLHNTARRVAERFQAAFASRDWNAMAELLADDLHNEDRRRVVNAGIRRGRDSMIEDMRAAADIGARRFELIDIATRGERLVLVRAQTRYSETPGAFHVDNLVIGDLDADGRTAAQVIFDPEDMDAAFAELDARYISGEAAAHAHIWSLVTQTYAAFNRHELSNTTPDWVNIDHRRAVGSAPGDMNTYVSAFWSLVPDISTRIEAVHRLSNLGAVFTHTESGTSQEGFDAEWREVALLTFVGDAINHCELFDETDLDAAIARFDALNAPAPQLENTATHVNMVIADAFNRRDLAGYLGACAADARYDDRRKGLRSEGPISAEFGHALLFDAAESWRLEVEPVALRGQHLALNRFVFRDADEADRPIAVDALVALEVNADQLVTCCLMFDPGDLGAALEELDARYLAGEAAPYEKAWAVFVQNLRVVNRHELPAWTRDVVFIDHRIGTPVAPVDMPGLLRATWDQTPNARIFVEAVYRLGERGAVFAHGAVGSSQESFEGGEWRGITVSTVDGDAINRCEIFDEADLDVALARFDELDRRKPRLENAASRAGERLAAAFAACDWNALERMLNRDFVNDDRRRVVNAGVRHGRDAELDDLRTVVDVGFEMVSWSVAATRGDNLALTCARYARLDEHPEAFYDDVVHIVELNADTSIAAIVIFDADNPDAAMAELDARYLAGEAAAHADTWAAIVDASAAFNRQVLPPTTPDWESVDHRSVIGFAPGEMMAYMEATWDVAPHVKNRIVTVHRLSDLGAMFTQASYATSNQGFDAEWHEIALLMMEGASIDRCEVFDENDLDTALARFTELDTG
ncbi:BTAD domain-containing putative transcriptional regulator [Mycolicibacterium sp. CR10]|uniref:BTAD domain-containing putative transcriptional regulator n=1 Tax=Mycolicibacterium sp. CR10 TaxID=2562314 RepID=UPI0010BFD9BF|nr:BTAD domain-containing putative transcriptional regulator [Mycolicibacterium sp. CR10]